jgi:hypothetical protein
MGRFLRVQTRLIAAVPNNKQPHANMHTSEKWDAKNTTSLYVAYLPL